MKPKQVPRARNRNLFHATHAPLRSPVITFPPKLLIIAFAFTYAPPKDVEVVPEFVTTTVCRLEAAEEGMAVDVIYRTYKLFASSGHVSCRRARCDVYGGGQ